MGLCHTLSCHTLSWRTQLRRTLSRRTAQWRLLIGGIDVSGDKAADTGAVDWVFSQ